MLSCPMNMACQILAPRTLSHKAIPWDTYRSIFSKLYQNCWLLVPSRDMKVGRGGISMDTESYMITSCFLTFLDGRLFEKNTLGSWKRREVLQKQQWSCIGSSYLLDFVRFIPFSFPELSLQTVFWNGWVPFCTTRVLGKEHFVKTFFSLTKTLFFLENVSFFAILLWGKRRSKSALVQVFSVCTRNWKSGVFSERNRVVCWKFGSAWRQWSTQAGWKTTSCSQTYFLGSVRLGLSGTNERAEVSWNKFWINNHRFCFDSSALWTKLSKTP